MKTVGLDFEFFGSQEACQTVVCAAISAGPTEHYKYWLEDNSNLEIFKLKLAELKAQDAIFLCFAASAESRSLESLGIDPFEFLWVDLYVEFRMLCNSNNRYNYGEYIDESGNIQVSTPPTPGDSSVDRSGLHTATPKNLVNTAYKMIDVRLDILEKKEMRNLLISGNIDEIRKHKEEILEYCLSDTKYLRAIDLAIQEAYKELGLQDFRDDQLLRGLYVVATGKCETVGIPLNMPLLEKIVEKTPEILQISRDRVNSLFPADSPMFTEYIPASIRTFKNGKKAIKKGKPSKKNMSSYYKLIESLNIPNFPKTDSGKYSCSRETLQEYRDSHPSLRELLLYNNTEANLKWFKSGNEGGFFDRVGSDNRIRPYYGTFGTQTGRNAAKAKTFPFAMSSWLRVVVQPPKGQFIVGADFASQELYIAAKLSEDREFLDAYNSGDFYLHFGKISGVVPTDATKTSHPLERDICKQVVLGLLYGLGAIKLALKLTQVVNSLVTEEEGKSYVSLHKKSFKAYWRWVYHTSNLYSQGFPLFTNDGWALWTDNPIATSIRNFKVQGTAASCTRLAVIMAWQAGLIVMCSLHDAIYILTDNPERDGAILSDIMIRATAQILQESIEECTIRVDLKTISHDEYWVENKGRAQWEEFKSILLGEEFRETA